MVTPLLVEILTYAPTAFYHCMHCEIAWKEIGMPDSIHREQVDSSLPPDLAQDYQEISDWVRDMCKQYDRRLLVKVIDAASIEGFLKSFRHGVHRYPAIIINGKARSSDRALKEAAREIETLLAVPGQI